METFFPQDPEVRSLVQEQLLEPLAAFFTGLNAYLLGFYPQAIEGLDAVRAKAGGSLPLASYYLGLAYLRAGEPLAGEEALSHFLKTVPPERRRGAAYADAHHRLGGAPQ